ncbi:MAG: polyisoprenoid-binding protein YceI [Bacteroidia bacterium]|jgi:polyisoprenoid-binding protein YceI
MKKTLLILSISAGVLFASCGDPKTATTEEAGETAEATVESVTYTVDAAASAVNWTGSKILDGSHTGTIAITSGSISAKEGVIESGSFSIDMASFVLVGETEEESAVKLMGHLKSADFFMVDTFPTASFEITSGGAEMVKGNLTIKGITKEIEIPVTVTTTDAGVTASSKFAINRNDWGITWGNNSTNKIDFLKDNFIKDEIEFDVNLVASK